MLSRRALSVLFPMLAVLGLAMTGVASGAGAASAPPAQTRLQTRLQAIDAACQLVKDDGGDVLDRACLSALAFDTRAYFGAWRAAADPDAPQARDLPGLVTAHFVAGRGGPRWAFVIDDVCPGKVSREDTGCPFDARREVIRVVTLDRPQAGLPPPSPPLARPPRSADDLRRWLDAVAQWREADLGACPKAAAALLALRDLRPIGFDPATRARITGRRASGDLVVTADGDGYDVEVGDEIDGLVAWDSGDPGGAGAWARRMLGASAPCLKPAPGPPPWR